MLCSKSAGTTYPQSYIDSELERNKEDQCSRFGTRGVQASLGLNLQHIIRNTKFEIHDKSDLHKCRYEQLNKIKRDQTFTLC